MILTQSRPLATQFKLPTFGHSFILAVASIQRRICLPLRLDFPKGLAFRGGRYG